MSNKTAAELQTMILNSYNQQLAMQKEGNYVEAQNLRLKVQHLRKQHQARVLFQMNENHRKQGQELQNSYNSQLSKLTEMWDQKIDQFIKDGNKQQTDMINRHQQQINKMNSDLDKQLSLKVKQSSELLNLRKMEQHMAKQKNYVEAHRVQTKINQLQKIQKDAWLQARNIKIDTNITQLKAKQNTQLNNLKKRIATGIDERTKTKQIQINKVTQRHANNVKQMKSRHEKQVLAYRGQFRSKGGNQGSPSPSKSKMH